MKGGVFVVKVSSIEKIERKIKQRKCFVSAANKGVLYILLVILLSSLYVLPVITKGKMFGDDIMFHLSRFRFLCEDIKNGSVFPFVHTSMFQDMGYASPICYPEFLFYPAALLNLAGASLLSCFKFYYFYTSVLIGLSFYFCSAKIFKEEQDCKYKFKAFIVFLIALLDPYRYINHYVRAAVGEFSAYIFVPIIILGCYYIIKQNKKPYVLALGMTGLLFTHFLSFIIACYVIAVVVIYNVKKVKKFALKLLIAAGECACLSAIVLLPFVEIFFSNKISAFSNSGLKFFIFDSAKINTGLPLIVGFIFLGLIIIYSVFCKTPFNRIIQLFLLLGLVLSDIFPWSFILFKPLASIQFSWRLVSVFYFSILYFTYRFFKNIKIRKSKLLVQTGVMLLVAAEIFCYVGFFAFGAMLSLSRLSLSVTKKDIDTSNEVAFGEYLPIDIVKSACGEENSSKEIDNYYLSFYPFDFTVMNSDCLKNIEVKNVGRNKIIKYEITNNEITVPVVYYKGYVASVNGENKVVYEKDGFCNLKNIPKSGEIKIEYKMTATQISGIIISLLSFLALVLVVNIRNKKACLKR